MTHEHDDDMDAEVAEGPQGEADQFAVVAEDVEERDADAETERLKEMEHNIEKAEGDEVDES